MKDKSSNALLNANKIGGGDVPPCVGVKSSALPEVQKPSLAEDSDTGVSTISVPSINHKPSSLNLQKHWYAMRTTTSSNNEKSDKRGICLFLDEKEVIALKESELPYHGTIPVKELGKHEFKFQVDIIELVDNGTIGASMSTTLPLPFSVTFD